MQQQASRVLLEQAHDFFKAKQYTQAKKLDQLNQTDEGIQLNKMIIQIQQSNRQLSEKILKDMMDMLTKINIRLYETNRPHKINFITHQMLYFNIVILSSQLGRQNITQLVGNEALFFYKSLRRKTVLPIIYECLKKLLAQNRLPSSFEVLQKFQKIMHHALQLHKSQQKQSNIVQQKYKILIHAMMIEGLLKLGMCEQSQSMFMMRFGDSEKMIFQNDKIATKKRNQINYNTLINFLQAQLEYFKLNYEKSINLLSVSLASADLLKQKIYAENNLGVTLSMSGKGVTAEKILLNACQSLYKLASNPKKFDPEIVQLYHRCKTNILLAQLNSRKLAHLQSHFSVQADQKSFNHMKHLEQIVSFKHQYRKGQCCLNLYHSMLQKNHRKLPWQEIHDNYDNVYYYPNQPYYQFKARNKNIHLANKKPVYRRYVLNQWNQDYNQEQADKDGNRRKYQKQVMSTKYKNLLSKAQEHFKKALMILEKEQAIVFKFEGNQFNFETVNQKLYHNNAKFKSSILCMLVYTNLCQCNWRATVRFAQEYQNKRCYEASSKDYYAVLSYLMEAYCQLDKIQEAYEIVHKIIQERLAKNSEISCRDGSNIAQSNIEEQVSIQMNLLYNLAIIQSRDNRIPEVYQSIQKLFTQLNINGNYPRANLPLSMVQLMIHYNLRAKDYGAALEMIKRRRILGGAMTTKPILNITK